MGSGGLVLQGARVGGDGRTCFLDLAVRWHTLDELCYRKNELLWTFPHPKMAGRDLVRTIVRQ